MSRLTIDLKKIEDNTRLVAGMLEPFGVLLVGVTKACLGNWHLAGAMLAGGAAALADSRAASINRLRRRLPAVELQLLRAQPGEEPAPEPADLVFVSSADQAQAFASAGGPRPMRLCLMVETGEGREGVAPEDAAAEAIRLSALPGAVLAGIATNAACASNKPSLKDALERFRRATAGVDKVIDVSRPIEKADHRSTRFVVSAGGSGLLGLLLAQDDPEWLANMFGGLTELRCGEALLLGNVPRGSNVRVPLPGAHQDAFVLEAPVLEVARRQGHWQALVALGIQDIGAGAALPDNRSFIAGQVTSDHLGLSCSLEVEPLPAVGDRLSFIPSYYALLAAMTSPFVEKILETGNRG